MRKSVLLLVLVWIVSLSAELRTFYPPIEPNRTGFLDVEGGHTIYWEESGNPQGKPILFVHGGPGMGSDAYHRTFFNPAYRIILFDQRGCGKSLPFSSLENNTTWDLVRDMEALREHLKIDKWVVFGGSWGSTLGLSYAIKNPERVEGMILRGIFLCRPKEIQWYYQEGANWIFPDLWEHYIAPIPPAEERSDFVTAYYKRLTSEVVEERQEAAKAWSGWEGGTTKLRFDPSYYAYYTHDSKADSIARIECHYFIHNTFFETDNWIIENIGAVRDIPCIIVEGRYDMACPILSAWELHRAWPEAQLQIVPDAGHASTEPGILDALIRATDAFLEGQ